MATYKDILYKMEDNETWTEWAKRVPDNDEDKLDYIGETIYDICIWDGKDKAYKITEMMIELGLEQLIPLLENEDLLNEKIEEIYNKVLCQKESLKDDEEEDGEKGEEKEDEKEDVWPMKTTITVAEMMKALSVLPPDAKLVITEHGFYSQSEFAGIMLPKPYKVGDMSSDRLKGCIKPNDMPNGTQVYRIGHSDQNY
jgi:hypothetical protein